ncbi:hypothetical protein TrRE_jg10883 [Triparma retinervis]|uniref:C3H1-type domain-containing protein n=1 Tax=Triparma retinervis TaxID=2557542 RepID=A0A9W7AH80_9STRA|nr:hypothetical protein TrRE_jg10883 [Triparma retinervis]
MPAFSQTLILKHFWANNPSLSSAPSANKTDEDLYKEDEEFFDFYEDVYLEASKFGVVEECVVCDNVGDHMLGHVYIKFNDEEDAADCLTSFKSRHYGGRMTDVEFSPVTDFRESRCRQFDDQCCKRGGFCNFMHIKKVPPKFVRSLREEAREAKAKMDEERRKEKEERRGRSESSGSSRSRSRSRSRSED